MNETNNKFVLLNDLYNLINVGQYDYVFDELVKLKDSKKYFNYQTEIVFLLNLVKEKIYNKSIIGKEEGKIKDDYLNTGRMASYFDEIDEAYNIFMAGYYVTEDIDFLYMAGRTLYFTQDKKNEGVKLLEEYIEKNGSTYLIKSYEYLSTYYKYLNTNLSKKYRKRSIRLSKLVGETNFFDTKNSYDNKESMILEYIKTGKIDYVLEMYKLSKYTKKIEIISELYKNGYLSLASKLLKQYKNENNSKHSKELVKQLEKNKTLYINKGKNCK